MSSTSRTDIHCPSKIIPADYSHATEYAQIPNTVYTDLAAAEELYGITKAESLYGTSKPLFKCDICGAAFTYGSLFLHVPTNTHITVGHTCAESLSLRFPLAQAKAIHTIRTEGTRARRRLKALKDFVRFERGGQFLRALKTDHHIIRSIRQQVIDRQNPSGKQRALVIKIAADQAAREAREAQTRRCPVPASQERQTITGEVLAVTTQSSQYCLTTKMTVEVTTPSGESYLIFGTAPNKLFSLIDAQNQKELDIYYNDETDTLPQPVRQDLKGSTVTFSCIISAGGRDPHFGFFARPTKPSIVLTTGA